MLKIQGITKSGKSFWPNICCKERRNSELEVCTDPFSKLNRTEIVPFAMAQGGKPTRKIPKWHQERRFGGETRCWRNTLAAPCPGVPCSLLFGGQGYEQMCVEKFFIVRGVHSSHGSSACAPIR